MQIDLPQELIERANRLATTDEDAAAVLARGVELMEWQKQEVAAVMEGVAAYERGNHEPLEAFDRRFRQQHGIPPKP